MDLFIGALGLGLVVGCLAARDRRKASLTPAAVVSIWAARDASGNWASMASTRRW